MTKTIILLTLLAAAINVNAQVTTQHFELPAAKVAVRVIDENQQPIENANVSLGFGDMAVKGMTDVRGLFTGEGRCGVAGIGSTITKDGYYLGSAPIPKFSEIDTNNNQWKPWDETYTAILRPIGKPVALYAKKVQTDIPVLNQSCAYDLEAGDWVMPYGKGMKKDLIFFIHKDIKNVQNFDAQGEVTFANPLDGLQETSISEIGKNSVFRWDRQAPENGYEPKFQLQNTWLSDSGQKPIRSFKFNDREWEGYFFRVRTVEQNDQIVSAYYGKIRGGIEIEPRESSTCKITFTYYFNPNPNDRNLEWKMKNDLFGGLTDTETPREP
jgi:hypothetical protein